MLSHEVGFVKPTSTTSNLTEVKQSSLYIMEIASYVRETLQYYVITRVSVRWHGLCK